MSLLSGAGAGLGDLLAFVQDGFVIIDITSGNAYKFDTYTSNSFYKQNQVPNQPVEMGSFASDSKVISPNIINVTAYKGLSIFNLAAGTGIFGNALSIQSVAAFQTGLTDLANNPNLVNLFINNKVIAYSETYSYYTLETLSWEKTPNQLLLVAQMQFKEVRLTQPSFTNFQQVANPNDSSPSNNGTVQGQTPGDNNTSLLKQLLDAGGLSF